MAAEAGRSFLLKLKSGTSLTTIASMTETGEETTGAAVEITNKDSAGKRTLLAGAGSSSKTINASGVLTDAAQWTTLENLVENMTFQDFQLNGNGLTTTATFQVTKLSRTGAEGDATKFAITLESTGDWTVA